MKEFDWRKPQRQPLAGLIISFLHTFWEVVKRLWPAALVLLLGKENKVNRYEWIALVLLVVTLVPAIFRYLYFKFYLEEDKLIIKKGWLSKETQIIPLDRIQTVNIEQGILHQLLNIVKVTIDTAGTQNAEATIEALHNNMALALKQELLLRSKDKPSDHPTELPSRQPLLTLGLRDLLKLSISANHLEAFFLLLTFGIGIYENLNDIDMNLLPETEDLPAGSMSLMLFMVVLVLIITLLVSTARIFIRFYNFCLFKTDSGYQTRSGLTNVRERLVSLKKIQYVSWRANWIRKLMGLWMLQYHITGSEELKTSLKVEIPLTQNKMAEELVESYHNLPAVQDAQFARMHISYVFRRVLVVGIIPAIVFALIFWWQLGQFVFLFALLPLLVWIIAWCIWKKFRLYAFKDVLVIKKGVFGEENIIVRWHKLQAVMVSQTIFQRRRGLAKLTIHTAGGSIAAQFIPLATAHALANYALFQTETDKEGWM